MPRSFAYARLFTDASRHAGQDGGPWPRARIHARQVDSSPSRNCNWTRGGSRSAGRVAGGSRRSPRAMSCGPGQGVRVGVQPSAAVAARPRPRELATVACVERHLASVCTPDVRRGASVGWDLAWPFPLRPHSWSSVLDCCCVEPSTLKYTLPQCLRPRPLRLWPGAALDPFSEYVDEHAQRERAGGSKAGA